MSWVKVDDKAWSHPKLVGLHPNALRLWLFGLCWCNQHETDGHIPLGVLGLLGGKARDAEALVKAGLWYADDMGWEVHQYLNYQPSKEQLDAKRNATAARVTAHRERNRNGVGNGVTSGVSNAPVTPLPIPSRPDPVTDKPPSPLAGGATTKRRKARVPIPEPWIPTPAHAELAKSLGVDMRSEAEKFRDHGRATGRLIADPDAAFRMWLRKSVDFRPRPVNGFRAPGPTLDDDRVTAEQERVLQKIRENRSKTQ